MSRNPCNIGTLALVSGLLLFRRSPIFPPFDGYSSHLLRKILESFCVVFPIDWGPEQRVLATLPSSLRLHQTGQED